jgi:hypothetical protein
LGSLSRESHAAELTTHRFDGFPVNAFPLAVEKMESGYRLSWTSEAGYLYVIELSRDLKIWNEDTRMLQIENGQMIAHFSAEELMDPLFLRVRSFPDD